MIVYLTIGLCAAALVALSYRYDLYDREPLAMIGAAIMMGFVMMAVVGRAEHEAFKAMSIAHDSLVARAAIVALFEDGGKFLVVLLIAHLAVRHFNDPLDGLIYGTLVGLGAGVEESLLYVQWLPDSAATLGGEMIRLLAHAMLGGVAGFGVGLGARPDRQRKRRPLPALGCLTIAVTWHFAWDCLAYQPTKTAAIQAGAMALMLALLMIWGVLTAAGSHHAHRVFARRTHAREMETALEFMG